MKYCTASITLFYFRVRDHHVFILDFSLEVFLDNEFILIVKLDIRHLISYKPNSIFDYLVRSKELFNYYRIE